jgi:hypothetical protein
MAKKKPNKTLRDAKNELARRAYEDGDTTLEELRQKRLERGAAKKEAKIGLEAAKNAYRGGRKTLQWTPAGREIVKHMRSKKTDYGRGYYVGEGDICKVRKFISRYDTFSGYGTQDIPVGAIVIITSAPYNPYGDGLRIDVLHNGESVQGVKLAKLVQIKEDAD